MNGIICNNIISLSSEKNKMNPRIILIKNTTHILESIATKTFHELFSVYKIYNR